MIYFYAIKIYNHHLALITYLAGDRKIMKHKNASTFHKVLISYNSKKRDNLTKYSQGI